MAKTITVGLKAHLAQTVTTLAVCWQIIRTDGVTFAFTAFDDDLVVSGITYSSIAGFSQTAMHSGSIGQVDNLDVLGFFSPDGITEIDLKNGLFNYAQIFLFAVNWADLSQGILRLRRGWLGECVRSPAGVFSAELRGMTQALTQEFGNVYSPICRADLGDRLCRVPIAPDAWRPGHDYTSEDYVSPATKSTDALKVAIYKCSSPGTSGGTEPTWAPTVSDGGVEWMQATPFRLIGTVAAAVNAHSFIAQPLVFPAADLGDTASISVRDNVSANTSIEISDGVNAPMSFTWPFDTAGGSAAYSIGAMVLAGGTGIQLTSTLGDRNILLKNTSGAQGVIVKTGDIALPEGLLITNFTEAYLDGGTITWLSGNNAGVSHEMKTYDANTSTVMTWLGMNYAPQTGDRFFYYPGCDKKRQTCKRKYGNIINFRGEPDMPGLDAALGYPDL